VQTQVMENPPENRACRVNFSGHKHPKTKVSTKKVSIGVSRSP